MIEILPTTRNFQDLFLSNKPMIDVRSPIEFSEGAFQYSRNFPLLYDHERHLIGIEYKINGQEAAIRLGYSLVNELEKQHRLDVWIKFINNNPDAFIYCFRGGLRSKISQKILADAGFIIPRIIGGYKAMRRYLLETLNHQVDINNFIVLGGRTGVGKTELINKFSRSIDLEAIAGHRGSAFGKQLTEQPPQITLENNIAVALLKLNHLNPILPIMVEDEGGKIGARCIPKKFHDKTEKSLIIILEDSLENRISKGFNDYILQPFNNWSQQLESSDAAINLLTQRIDSALLAISKRLGGLRYKEWQQLAKEGLVDFFQDHNKEKLNLLIRKILIEYYDPMYDYQIQKKNSRIVFRGYQEEIFLWLEKSGILL